MAYIDAEHRSARLIWSTIKDKVMIASLIVAAMILASFVVTWLEHAPSAM